MDNNRALGLIVHYHPLSWPNMAFTRAIITIMIIAKILYAHSTNQQECLKSILKYAPEETRHVSVGEVLGFCPCIIMNVKNLKNFLDKTLEKPQSFTLKPKSLESLQETLRIIGPYQSAKYALILPQGDDLQVQAAAQILWKFRLPNSIIITQGEGLDIFSIEVLKCGLQSKARHLLRVPPNSCPNSTVSFNFDFKASFAGCPLKVLWNEYQPYIYPKNQTFGWQGIFVDALEALSHISGRPILRPDSDWPYMEEISMEYNYESVVADLGNEAEMFMGSADIRTMELFDLSPIVMEDRIIFMVPRSLYDYWRQFGASVGGQILSISTLLFFVDSAFVFYLARFHIGKKKMKKASDVLLMGFGMMFGIGMPKILPNYSLLRMFLGQVLLLCMVLNCLVQASLVSSLTSLKYRPPVGTKRELLDTNLPLKLISVLHGLMEYEARISRDWEMLELSKRSESIGHSDINTLVDELIKERNFATLLLEAFLFGRPGLEKTFSFFAYAELHNCFAMEKNSYSSPYYYDWISRILETGFFERFKKLQLFLLGLKYGQGEEAKAFVVTIGQIGLALSVLKFGCLLGVVVLILEMIWFRFEQLRAKCP